MPPPSSGRSRRRLHPRAIAVAATGCLALIASGGFGTPALRPIGLGLLALGVAAIVLVEVTARGTFVARTLDRTTMRAGERGLVTMRLHGWPVRNRLLSVVGWQVRAGLPASCDTDPRRPTTAGGEVRQLIGFSGIRRGEHRLEPPGMSIGDPFGLARARRVAFATDTLLVLPRTVPITVPFWESGAARRSGEQGGYLRGRAELGGVRDYEPGDPFSLIHWGHTARRGHLQTKELHGESGRGASLLVMLDAHESAGADDGVIDMFEVAVEAAASLVVACAARGDSIGFEHTAGHGRAFPIGSPPDAIERELATVRADGSRPLGQALRASLGRIGSPRTVVLVSSGTHRSLATAVRHARSGGCNVAAVLVGSARAFAHDLRRAGAAVVEVESSAELAGALGASARTGAA